MFTSYVHTDRGVLRRFILPVMLGWVLLGTAASGVGQPGSLTFSSVTFEGNNLVASGSGGLAGATYYVMSSTNVGLPLASWPRIATNVFGSSGEFTNTIPVNPSGTQSFFALLMNVSPPASPPLTAAYPFEEGTGTTTADVSSNHITGTLHSTTWTTAGEFGKALSFNGTSSYVDLGNPAALKLTGSMTVEAWVFATTNLPDDGQIVAKSGSTSPTEGWQFKTSPDTGLRTFAIGVSASGASLVQRYSGSVVELNTWFHVAGVYNASARTLDIYVNGVLDNGLLKGTVPASQFDPAVNVNIGRRIGGWYFKGTIDEVRIYNTALTPAQIQADMNTPLGNFPSAPANLSVTVADSSQVNLSWAPAFSRVGVASYRVERSQGAGSTNFTQIGTVVGTTYIDATVSANTIFNYRVRAMDTANNLGPYSSVVKAYTGMSIIPRLSILTPPQVQQFTISPADMQVNWFVDGVQGGSDSSGTITATGLYSPPASAGAHTITATTTDQSQSTNATVYVTTSTGVFTRHNDNFRTGQNQNETVLTPASVSSATFGKLFSYTIDSGAYASPLYVANVDMNGAGIHNVVYVASQHDTVYAFDADGLISTPLWKVSFINPFAGITTIPSSDADPVPSSCCDLNPDIGIIGTPVIDPLTGTMYLVAATREISGNTTNYVQRLHALDITTGSEMLGGPVAIQASVSGTGDGSQGGVIDFDPLLHGQRAGLLLSHGVVYIAFGSHDDTDPYHGWVLGYDATTLQRVLVYNDTRNGSEGGIWHAGGGLGADDAGNIYFSTGNGTFDANSGGADYGDSVEKLGTNGIVLDYFTPHDQAAMAAGDLDLSSGGLVLLPDQSGPKPHLLIAAGKSGTIYLLNRDSMGHFNPNNDNQIVQSIVNGLPGGTGGNGSFKPPAYFNGNVFFGAVDDFIRVFHMNNGLLSSSPTSMSAVSYGYPGAAFSLSANGNANGILWALQRQGDTSPGILRAYDALNLGHELYNSTQAGSRDTLDGAVKFTPPTIANGKVFVGSLNKLTVYGLLP